MNNQPTIKQQFDAKTILLWLLVGAAFLTGYFAWQWWEVRQELISQTQQIERLTEQIENLQDWKIYSNEEYGFEFKYPKDWKRDTSYGREEIPQIFYAPNHLQSKEIVGKLELYIDKGPKNSLDSYLNPPEDFGVLELLESKNILIDSVSGARKTKKLVNGVSDSVIVQNQNSIYIITVFMPKNKLQEYENIFNKIISTFKFTEAEILLNTVTKPEYFDDNLKSGDSFLYGVEAINDKGEILKNYQHLFVKIPQNTTTFNNAEDLWGAGDESFIDLKWNPYDFKKFRVYKNDISDWKTYGNDAYRFEFKYPDIFSIVSEDDDSMVIIEDINYKCPPEDYYCDYKRIVVRFFYNQGGLKIDEWFDETYKQFTKAGTQVIAGKNAIIAYPKETEAFGTKYVFAGGQLISDSAYQYIFDMLIYSGVNEELQNQILSTFKFTD